MDRSKKYTNKASFKNSFNKNVVEPKEALQNYRKKFNVMNKSKKHIVHE